jgi:putative inorganic carbon (HCO3(-)) transporter
MPPAASRHIRSGIYMFSNLIKLLKATSFPVWLLSFYILIWFLQIGNRIDFLGAIRIEFIAGAILFAFSVKELIGGKKPQSVPSFHAGFIRSIFFLYAFFIVYSFLTYDTETSRNVFTDRILKFSMIALFIGTLVKSKEALILVLLGFCLAMMKITQEGAFGILTGGLIWENQGIPRLHGVTLMYRHPNSLAGLAVSALPFFLFLFRFQTRFLKLIFAGIIVGLLATILYTGSRTGYVATLLLFLAILLHFGLFKVRSIALLSMLMVVAFFLVPEEYKGRFGTMFKSEGERGSSADKRMEIIEDAWYIAKAYPLGVGVGAFPYVREVEFGRKQDTHNLYLEILTNLGPFGLIAFIIFIALLFKTNRRSRVLLMEKKEYFLAEVCYIVNLYILCRLALGLFGMDLYEVYWWFAAGLTIALAKLAAEIKDDPAAVVGGDSSRKIPVHTSRAIVN